MRKKLMNKRNDMKNRKSFRLLLFSGIVFIAFYVSGASADIFDRVVAFVDNQAITLSEFQEEYRNTLKVTPDISEEDVINTMVNRLVLLREAKKYRIEAPSREE